MKFKNMKIKVNEDQPLSEIIVELERLRYVGGYETGKEVNCVLTFDDYPFDYELLNVSWSPDLTLKAHALTTLDQLRGMS